MNRTRTSLLLAILVLALIVLKPIWTRLCPSSINLILLLVTLGLILMLLVLLCATVYKLFSNGDFVNFKSYVPILIIAITGIQIWCKPLEINVDSLYGKVSYEACRKGTQSRSTFKLRNNNRFEIHHTGVFFHEEYDTGKYEIRNDTLELLFNDRYQTRKIAVKRIGVGISIINSDSKSLIKSTYFYEGKCQKDS